VASSLVLGALAFLLVGEFLLFAALAESYRDIAQLRHETGMTDRLGAVELGEAVDATPSAYGLNVALDHASKAIALFVDTRCGTCKLIVESLNGALPLGTDLTLFAESESAGFEWLGANGFEPARVDALPISIVTPGWSNPLGVDVTPLVIEIEQGKIARAFTIPSVRRFYSLIPNTPYRLPVPTTRVEAIS
jgi:hypothetical protein